MWGLSLFYLSVKIQSLYAKVMNSFEKNGQYAHDLVWLNVLSNSNALK